MSDEASSPQFGTPYQALIKNCEEHEIHFDQDPAEKAIRFTMAGAVANYRCVWHVTVEDKVAIMWIH